MNCIIIDDVEIMSDDKTVWVNSSTGENIGRFSMRGGIDVHNTIAVQEQIGKQCLFCRPGPTSKKDWQDFKLAMFQHYKIVIPEWRV